MGVRRQARRPATIWPACAGVRMAADPLHMPFGTTTPFDASSSESSSTLLRTQTYLHRISPLVLSPIASPCPPWRRRMQPRTYVTDGKATRREVAARSGLSSPNAAIRGAALVISRARLLSLPFDVHVTCTVEPRRERVRRPSIPA